MDIAKGRAKREVTEKEDGDFLERLREQTRGLEKIGDPGGR